MANISAFQANDRSSILRTRTTDEPLEKSELSDFFFVILTQMQYSQKYTLVAFLKPMKVGAEFAMADWPLHTTLADVFAIELDAIIEQNLTDLLAKQPSICLSVGEDAKLGNTRVALINKNSELQDLHDTIINVLELHGAKFNAPEFTRKGFLPHSTIQKFERLNAGDEFEITFVSLIDMFPGGDWQKRKVLNNFNLKQA